MAIFSAIGAAVAAVSGWIGSLGAFGAFALRTAVGVGLSLAAQALAGKAKTEEQKFSINTGLSGGGALSRSFIVGRAATGGSLVWANTWGNSNGSPNAWLTQVIALSDMPIKALSELWVDGVRVTYDYANNNAHAFGQSIPEYENDGPNMYVKIYDGTQTAADPSLVSNDSTPERPWSSNRVGRGVAYAIIRVRAKEGVYSGIPQFKFVVDGMRLYDPSRDSTNGGVGPQRYSDQSTWGGDGDYLPAVQAYNLLRGIYFEGRWVYGMQGVTNARLPSDNWPAQIEKCRAEIIESGGPQPTYRCGGEIEVNAPLSIALDEILTTCQGKISESGGVYRIFLGEPDAPFFSITDDDIVSTEEQSFTPFFGLSDTINGIAATYPEPIDGYVERAAPPLFRPDLEILDGNRRLMADVQFTFVPYSEQVQRLMKSALLASLRQRRHTITLPPRFWRFAVPGETLRWTSERNGYVNKLFVIDGVSDKANLDVTIDITEYDPSDYSWSSDTEFQPPTSGALGPIVPPARSVIDPFVEPYILRDESSGARRPAIRLVWDNSTDTIIGVMGVEWEIRLAGTTEVVITGNTSFPERGSVIISSGIIPNTTYEVRMRYIGQPGERQHNWTGWLPVLSPNVLLGEGDIEVRLRTINEDAKYVWKQLSQQLDDVWKRVEHLAQASSLDGATGQLDRQEIRVDVGRSRALIREEREVRATETEALARRSTTIEASVATANAAIDANGVSIAQNTARIQQEEIARASADEAFGTQLTTINANVASNAAAILTEQTARANGDTANAEAITALRAETAAGLAEGMIRFEAVSAPAGVTARFALLLRVNSGGAFMQSGFFVEIYNDSGTLRSRTVFDTQQFIIQSGGTNTLPFLFEGGVLKLALAHIVRITSGEIEIGRTLINSNGIVVSS